MTWVLVIYYMVGYHSFVQKMDVHTKKNCEEIKKEWQATAPKTGDYLNSMNAYCVQEIAPKNQLPNNELGSWHINTQDGI